MKKLFILPWLCLFIFTCCQNNPDGKLITDEDAFDYLRENIVAPGQKYGSAPLWVWNTEVDEEIIENMMREFKDKGFGGVFIHPRPGLISEYLSDEWFALCQYTLEMGKKYELDVWIYDENSYPSGFAGGHVPAQMPESFNQGQMLHLIKTEVLPDTVEEFYISLKYEADVFVDITNSLTAERGKTGEYYLLSKENYRKSPWYGGFSYVDLLVKGVTEKFIEVTMDGYERAMGTEFGKLVPGVFTDEPNIEVQGRGNIRWTPDLFEEFEKTWNYDLKLHLPSLFTEIGDWQRVRHNYYQTLLQMFIDRWSKPWYAYTEQKGLEWTGHYWEHGWPNPNHGGDNMAMYAWHQRPSIDMLFNQFDEESPNAQFGNVRAVKELSSVANQMNRRRTLSETYGGAGWELTFMDMKRLGDWEYALGVNTMNQHLSYMTMKGARKYDYPQSFTHHSTWWPYYKPLNQYFARLSLALSRGKQTGDILVLEPTTSAWMYAARQNPNLRMREIGWEFQAFVTKLEKAQVEYDLGSENIIKDHGSVQDGRFVIGEKTYALVVIPPGMENLDASTFEIIKSYATEDGNILCFTKPGRIDGTPSKRLEAFFNEQPGISFEKDLDKNVIQSHFTSDDFRILDSKGGNLYHHRRRMTDGQVLFLVNSSMGEYHTGKLSVQGRDVLLFDLFSGDVLNYPEKKEGDHLIVDYRIPPAGSLLLFISENKKEGYPEYQIHKGGLQSVETSALNIQRLQPNVLTIDFCDLNLGGSTMKDVHNYTAADTVYKHHGFKDGNPWNHSVQYRDNIISRDTFPTGTGFIAYYHFTIDQGVDVSEFRAVVERPENWSVTINGELAEQIEGAWWLDEDFAVYDVGKQVHEGENTLTLVADPMKVHAEIEPVYILGDFSLIPKTKGWKISSPQPLSLGSWKDHGLPLYGQEVAYSKTFNAEKEKSYVVHLGDWEGTTAVVSVNNKDVEALINPPYELDISDLVKVGENKVEVRVAGSLKNTLGPHYNNPKPGLVSPWQWRNINHYPSGSEYDLYDYGMMEDFEIMVAK